jgi:hypothetical protein
MKTILVSIVFALSSHFAFAEEPKADAAATPPAAAAPAATPADAKTGAMGDHMKDAQGKMHAAMGGKQEKMMKMCQKMHPDMDCEKMMGACSGEKNPKKCMDKMAVDTKK